MAIEALAIDANVLVAAMMGGGTRDLVARVRRAGVELFAPEEILREVQEHLPELADFSGARIDQFKIALWSMPVERVEAREYRGQLERAMELIGERDPDDIPLVALALARGVPVWTNDRDFKGIRGVQALTTREVAALFAEPR